MAGTAPRRFAAGDPTGLVEGGALSPVRPVGVGILGAGMIASRGVGPAVAAAAGAKVVAVGARSGERAAALAAVLGGDAATGYAGYEAVLADPAVELVYVALPNDAHLRWVLAALAAGRHVLVEKPLGLDLAEATAAFDAARAAGLVLVEATWARWHPRTRTAEAIVADGAIGEVTSVDAGFCFDGVPASDYRMDPARGGGALYDVGCYALSAALWATGGGPLRPSAVEVRRSAGGVDLVTDATLTSATGATVHVRAAIDEPPSQWLTITGAEGSLSFGDPAFTAWRDDTATLELTGRAAGSVRSWPPVDPYRLMVEAVASRVRGGDDWVVPPGESLAVAGAIDAVRAAGHEGREER